MERAPVPAEELDVPPTASEDGSESEPDSASDSGWGTDVGTASDGVGESDTDTDAHHRCDSDGEGAEADGELLARTTASGGRSRIKDYSLASPLERLAAAVEVTLRKWAAECLCFANLFALNALGLKVHRLCYGDKSQNYARLFHQGLQLPWRFVSQQW